MKKPILVTNIDDSLIKHEAFSEPHKAIWQKLIEKTKDKSLYKWIGRKDYFIGVDLAMDKIIPKATKQEKTLQVRGWYQEAVIEYIQKNPDCINKDIADKLKELKAKHKLILMTSNTKKYINNILSSANLLGLYDAVVASETEQEPKKSELIETLLAKYGKPKYYLTGKDDEETNQLFIKKGIKIIGKEEIVSI